MKKALEYSLVFDIRISYPYHQLRTGGNVGQIYRVHIPAKHTGTVLSEISLAHASGVRRVMEGYIHITELLQATDDTWGCWRAIA
jgi:hypothetical protein